ncbi:MAG: hypothetical protein AB8G05_25110 [Oligoflexales bacterium]
MQQHPVDIAWNSLLTAFGEEIEVIPRNGEPFEVNMIFRENSEEIGPDFSRSLVRTNRPHCKYRPEDKHISVGDKLEIRGKLFRTEEKIPDGYGGIVFELQLISEANKCS